MHTRMIILQQLVVRTGGKQLVVNQYRSKLKEKMHGEPLGIEPKASDLSCRCSDH